MGAAETPRLLILDDESRILSSLRRALRREGYEILTFERVEDALRELEERPVDAILSDQKMPGMSGLQFLRRAAQHCPEAARLLIQSSVYSGREAWVSEVMAQVVARSTLARDPSNVLGELERLFARLGQSNGQTGLQSLDRFAATRDPQERLWFQARFFEAARLLSGNDQGQAAKKLFKRMRKRGGQMTSADLLDWYPVLSGWLEQRFGREQFVNR